MKTLIKLLALSLMLPVMMLGQTVLSSTTTATTAKQAITNGASVFSFTVTDTSGSANRIYLRDNDGGSSYSSGTNRAIPSYTVIVSYPTNLVSTYTNAAGVIVSVTNSIQYTTTSVQATNLLPARLVNLISIPANGTVSWYPDSPQGVTYGLQLLSVGATTYSLTYLPLP